MSHSTSRTWISDQMKQYENYKKVSANFPRVAPKSPVLPTSFKDWLAHQEAMLEQAKTDKQRDIQRKIQQEIDSLRSGGSKKKKRDRQPAFDVTKFDDGRSSVLAWHSIWVSRDVEPARPHIPWPTNDELKESGVYRASSGQSRAAPRPRMDADPSMKWKERPLIAIFEFDDISASPSKDKDKTAKITNGASFLGLELLKELDI